VWRALLVTLLGGRRNDWFLEMKDWKYEFAG